MKQKINTSDLNSKYDSNSQLYDKQTSYVLQNDKDKYKIIAVANTPAEALEKRKELEKQDQFSNLKGSLGSF